MPRTLVISDLHFGARGRQSVLESPAALERLLAAVSGHARLVLLGDVLEMAARRPQQAMLSAVPVLRELGRRLGTDGEVLFVLGNHDRPLARRWIRARGRNLEREAEVPADASPALSRLVEALAPAKVSVRYPGVWLAEGVWATHGHYLDRHLFPVSAYGIVRGSRHSLTDERATPWDYERGGRVQLSPLVRWLPGPAARAADGLAGQLRAATMPGIKSTVLDPRIAPLTAALLGVQMRRHSLPAIARVADELGVQARFVVFGHVHRLGPMPDDDPSQWRSPAGAPRLINTGSWLYEPRLVNRARPPHPYWPGGAVSLEDGQDPQVLSLLDDLDVEELC